ncbi:MAG: hypothetical protein ACREHF_11545 [Rhizomicrobium sp.]
MLKTVHLRGKVLPEAVEYTLKNVVSFGWIWQERNATLQFRISIQKGEIRVECDMEDFRDQDPTEIHRRAYDLCRALVSMNAFREGVGLFVWLDRFTGPSGKETTLLGHDRRLGPLCTAIHSDDDFNKVFPLVLEHPVLIRHLTDLIISITIPHEALINCARVVEGIKNLMSPDETDDKRAWQAMRDALNIEREYLVLITESSTNARHGRGERRGGLLLSEITLRAWTVMNRYLEYWKRGNGRLPLSEFPLLKQRRSDQTPMT